MLHVLTSNTITELDILKQNIGNSLLPLQSFCWYHREKVDSKRPPHCWHDECSSSSGGYFDSHPPSVPLSLNQNMLHSTHSSLSYALHVKYNECIENSNNTITACRRKLTASLQVLQLHASDPEGHSHSRCISLGTIYV